MQPDSAKSEKAIVNETLVTLSALPETIVWRHNTGQAWAGRRVNATIGQTVVIRPGMVILLEAQPLTFGLPGSGDILGASRGRPLSVELKDSTGRQSEVQKRFEVAWVKAGGIYVLARSAREARDAIDIK